MDHEVVGEVFAPFSYIVFYISYNTGYVKITTNCTVGSGVTLVLPYGTGSGDRNTGGAATIHYVGTDGKHHYSEIMLGFISGDGAVATPICNTLVVIADGVRLLVNSGGTLEIAGELTGSAGGTKAGYTQGKYAELQLEGSASVEINGTANITGYINNADGNNSGSMLVNGGGKLYQPFTLIDFKGGSLLAAIYYGIQEGKEYTPFSQFVMQNVTVKLTMKYGSSMDAYCNLTASKQHNHTIARVIGSGGIIELTNGSYSYLESKYDPLTGKVKLNIYGGATTNVMALSVVGNDINSKDFVFGISWIYDITLARAPKQTDTALFNMVNSNKLLPGAKLVVEAGAQLNIDKLCIYGSSMESDVNVTGAQPFIDAIHAGVYPKNLSAAEFIVRGTVIAETLAGIVKTDVENAVVKVTGSTSMTTREPTVMTGESTSAQITEDKVYTWNLVLVYTERVSNPIVSKDYKSKDGTWITVENAEFTVPSYYDIQWTVDGVTYSTVGKTGDDRKVSIPVGAGVTVTIIPAANYMYFPNDKISFGSYSEWQSRNSNNQWIPTTATTPSVYWVPSLDITKVTTDTCTITYTNLGTTENSTKIVIVTTKTNTLTIRTGWIEMSESAQIKVEGVDQSNIAYAISSTGAVKSLTDNSSATTYKATIKAKSKGEYSVTVQVTITVTSSASVAITGS